MFVDIFGNVYHIYELNNSIAIQGDALYIFTKQVERNGKAWYEYLGSLFSTLEDRNTTFMSAFLDIATHYVSVTGLQPELHELKNKLDRNDRELYFEGKGSV
jgi:hypothetical protein